MFVKQAQIVRIGKMAALVAVDDLRSMAAQCPFQADHYESLFQGAGKLKIHDPPAVPVDDDKQIHESLCHPDICNIDSPNLIRLRDGKGSQQVRPDIFGMIALAQIGLRINRIDSHVLHDPSDSLPVDAETIVSPDDSRNCPVAPGWMGSVDLVDSTHEKQLLIGDGSLFRRFTVYAAPVDI